ncbi:hypothetical protein [Herbaspirillum huttiense]|uniref:hypothetical protein n=1 Tax=Herbaspirillum huttiense TaxID=863372 RepID=UPI003B3A9DCF
MSWIITASKISLLAAISFSADTAAVYQETIYLDVEMQNRCGFALTLADTIDGVNCRGDRQLTDAYLWRRSSRLKKSDLVRDCPYDAIDKECFLLIIGNTTVTLYSDLICLPRNGKKTDPAEFDVGDFMKMIYSITFDSQ